MGVRDWPAELSPCPDFIHIPAQPLVRAVDPMDRDGHGGSTGPEAGIVVEGRPLIVTADDALLDELLRIAAAARVEVAHSRDVGSRTLWRSSPIVLIDAAQVPAAVACGMPRRPGVIVVFDAEPVESIWQLCIALGVERSFAVHGSEVELIELLVDSIGASSWDGRCVAVMGACGGAGASVFAGAVAFAAARSGRPALLLDCDPWGAGLDVVLGLENHPGLRWTDLAAPSGRLPVDELSRALPRIRVGGSAISVLAHRREGTADPDPEAVEVVIDAGRRGACTTVVDLPRQPGPVPDRVLERCDLLVVVAPADVRACWAAQRVRARLAGFAVDAALVVRGPSPCGLGAAELAELLELPLLAQMRAEPGLAHELEFGLSLASGRRRPLLKAADRVLAQLDARR
jgi:secretion/DNA translocation related CpaE-like protein